MLMNEKEYNKFIKIVRDGCMDGFSLANWESEKMEYLVKSRAKEREEREKKEKEEFKKEKQKQKLERKQIKLQQKQLKSEKEQLKDEKEQLKEKKEELEKEQAKFEQEKIKSIKELKENTIQTIKKMLDNGLDYNIISKISGKTINEIKEIENYMQK